MWNPEHDSYFKTLANNEAVELCEHNNPEGDDVLLTPPSKGGWKTTLDYLREEGILRGYPGMVNAPWIEAAAIRLSKVSHKEKDGRHTKTIKDVSVALMWQPEYDHHARREGIQPKSWK